MTSAKKLKEWLANLPDDSCVAIDEGGLTLVEVHPKGLVATGTYFEIGGVPITCMDCGKQPADDETWCNVCPKCEAAAKGVAHA